MVKGVTTKKKHIWDLKISGGRRVVSGAAVLGGGGAVDPLEEGSVTTTSWTIPELCT